MSKQPKQERTRSPYHATKEISQNNKKISVLDFSDSEDESNTEKDLVAQKIANYGIKNKKDNIQTQTYTINSKGQNSPSPKKLKIEKLQNERKKYYQSLENFVEKIMKKIQMRCAEAQINKDKNIEKYIGEFMRGISKIFY